MPGVLSKLLFMDEKQQRPWMGSQRFDKTPGIEKARSKTEKVDKHKKQT